MNSKTLHPDVVEFVSSLQKLEAILTKHEQDFWAEKLTHVRKLAEKSDGFCVQRFEALFGGMGSFSDLVLDNSVTANSEFSAERTRAYALAQALK